MSVSRRTFAKSGALVFAGLLLGNPLTPSSKTYPAGDVRLVPLRRADGFWVFLPNAIPAAAVRRDTISRMLVFDTTVIVGVTPTRLASGYVCFI